MASEADPEYDPSQPYRLESRDIGVQRLGKWTVEELYALQLGLVASTEASVRDIHRVGMVIRHKMDMEELGGLDEL